MANSTELMLAGMGGPTNQKSVVATEEVGAKENRLNSDLSAADKQSIKTLSAEPIPKPALTPEDMKEFLMKSYPGYTPMDKG